MTSLTGMKQHCAVQCVMLVSLEPRSKFVFSKVHLNEKNINNINDVKRLIISIVDIYIQLKKTGDYALKGLNIFVRKTSLSFS